MLQCIAPANALAAGCGDHWLPRNPLKSRALGLVRNLLYVAVHPGKDSTQMMNAAYATTKSGNRRDLAHYFEYSNHGIEVVNDGLEEISFGEFLVDQRVMDRSALLRALQFQDQHPGTRMGECVAAMGILPFPQIEQYLKLWNAMDVVVV